MGQAGSDVADYLDHVDVPPGGATGYWHLPRVNRPLGAAELPRAEVVGQWLTDPRLANSVLHLSVPWVSNEVPLTAREQEENVLAQRMVAEGHADPAIDSLAEWCSEQRRPILLRPGYEFNRLFDWYYDRRFYGAGFRRIVERFRRKGVGNVAFVWSSTNINYQTTRGSIFDSPDPDEWDFDGWYPGDDWVDWFGFSFWSPSDPDTIMMEEATRRGKPVLLSECTPITYDLSGLARLDFGGAVTADVSPQEIWDGWFRRYFAFIESNEAVGGFHYISTNWKGRPLWQSTPPFIGIDSRVWINEAIRRRWTTKIRERRYLRGSRGLFRMLNRAPQ